MEQAFRGDYTLIGNLFFRIDIADSRRDENRMIGATALVDNLALATCNPDDFAGIDGLTVLDWTI